MYQKRKKTYEKHNIWRSYSDMLSGLLLLFILVMCISFMQAQKNYQERLAEEAAHQLTQEQLESELADRESQVASQQSALDEQSALLATQQENLDSQAAQIASQQTDLDSAAAQIASQEESLASQAAQLSSQAELLASQQASLDAQEQLLSEQQEKIEQIIGVKADLISELKQEFDNNNINVSLDETDGSLSMDSNVLFGYNENELTEEGNSLLGSILPLYCKVLLQDQYIDYLAEIRIDGYTDTDGDYLYNLQLSQERALAVANYLVEQASSFLSAEEIDILKEKLTANGHSMSNPVLSEDGTVDKDASRRVEIKFSLKDEDMINELKQILG